jgi:hypothetical protein
VKKKDPEKKKNPKKPSGLKSTKTKKPRKSPFAFSRSFQLHLLAYLLLESPLKMDENSDKTVQPSSCFIAPVITCGMEI